MCNKKHQLNTINRNPSDRSCENFKDVTIKDEEKKCRVYTLTRCTTTRIMDLQPSLSITIFSVRHLHPISCVKVSHLVFLVFPSLFLMNFLHFIYQSSCHMPRALIVTLTCNTPTLLYVILFLILSF